jgi:hypothetical protein
METVFKLASILFLRQMGISYFDMVNLEKYTANMRIKLIHYITGIMHQQAIKRRNRRYPFIESNTATSNATKIDVIKFNYRSNDKLCVYQNVTYRVW